MNDFQGLLSTDYGFKPQGKAAPMASQKSTSNFSSASSKTSSFHSASSLIFDDDDTLFRADRKPSIDDFSDLGNVFSNKLKKSSSTSHKASNNVDFDSIFGGSGNGGGDSLSKFSSLPIFDKPVFDDEVSSSAKYEDVFSSSSRMERGDVFDDLLGGLGKKESQSARYGDSKSSIPSFDDLLPDFGNGSSINRTSSEVNKKTSSVSNDPFVIVESTSPPTSSSSGILDDPLEEIGNLNKKNTENSNGVLFDDIDPLSGLSNSIPSFSPDINGEQKNSNPFSEATRVSEGQTSSVRSPYRVSDMKMPGEDYSEVNANFRESNSHGHGSLSSEDDIWLTVSEVSLSTKPTVSPPPSRPPPPRPKNFSASNVHKKVNGFSSFPSSVPNFQNPQSVPSGVNGSFSSPLDELEEFAMGRNRSEEDTSSDIRSSKDFDANSVAEAMKEAMERAEAKFRHAKGVRERENAKAFKNRDSVQVEKDEKPMYDPPLEREQQQKEREEEEKRRREEEEREREKRRVERERQAVERAGKEARERAAIEARARAERVAVQRAQADARERAERAAVQRAQAEARERAQAGAKERAEKAALEAREKAKAEAREREAREREASERIASEGRVNQQKNDNDLDSFFSMDSRASSAPRPRTTSSDPFGTDQFQSKPEATRTSVNNSSSMRKASSTTNIVDDLSSIFGVPPSSNDFQEFEGETEDRRKARMERHQRTQERAAKALAEKNARDLEVQREQAERNRIAETLDVEIRRWAAGKEGNLRALLSTLQYVLWPECGWQAVSLTDLITGASVKKVYRKATLCIHPDKVQQKGATLQQKYVAEKVFDLLKEAWNKFNSEELF